MDIFQRSKQLLSLGLYPLASQELYQTPHTEIDPPQDQYILRMRVRTPEVRGLQIPPELVWLRSTIEALEDIQHRGFGTHPYIYVTVRAGTVKSVTDDEWHVDGFSMRTPHVPEQNYIWSDCYPTEVLEQSFTIPADFDPLRHNLHSYFQDHADSSCIVALEPRNICIIDPYVVHRRPAVPVGTQRCFFRISFVPVEIEDDTCTPNPLLPPRVYNRRDVRQTLVRYAQN